MADNPAVLLGELAAFLPEATLAEETVSATSAAVPVSDITHDSRQCQPGMMFACVVGANHDGHDFAGEAIQAGAAALLVQRKLSEHSDVPQLLVPDVREALGACAAAIHHHPSQRVSVIGVTGTAGKTSVTHAISQMLNATQRHSELLGTLQGARTTPEAPDLSRWLNQVADTASGAFAVVEVSSHALALGRVNGIEFAAGVFTNLSPEHLDFHTDMEDYFQAKAKLFDGRSSLAVINTGNEWGNRLHQQVSQQNKNSVPIFPYSVGDMSDVEVGSDYLSYTWRGRRLTTRLCGRINLENLAAAAATGLALELSETEVVAGLESVQPVPGRMQPITAPASQDLGITVLVDYAHKPDALAAALASARELAAARLWAVFGAGGDRDKAKRPLMGEVASELADFVVVTSDNPRSEDPAAIAAEIEAGYTAGRNTADRATSERILNRSEAIGYAIANAAPGDVVLIAGKGHESTQIDSTGAKPFDDAEVAAQKLNQRSSPERQSSPKRDAK